MYHISQNIVATKEFDTSLLKGAYKSMSMPKSKKNIIYTSKYKKKENKTKLKNNESYKNDVKMSEEILLFMAQNEKHRSKQRNEGKLSKNKEKRRTSRRKIYELSDEEDEQVEYEKLLVLSLKDEEGYDNISDNCSDETAENSTKDKLCKEFPKLKQQEIIGEDYDLDLSWLESEKEDDDLNIKKQEICLQDAVANDDEEDFEVLFENKEMDESSMPEKQDGSDNEEFPRSAPSENDEGDNEEKEEEPEMALRLRALNETYNRLKEELALAKQSLEEEKKSLSIPGHVCTQLDPCTVAAQVEARLRMKREAAAANYCQGLYQVEQMVSQELSRLYEDLEMLQPLNELAADWNGTKEQQMRSIMYQQNYMLVASGDNETNVKIPTDYSNIYKSNLI